MHQTSFSQSSTAEMATISRELTYAENPSSTPATGLMMTVLNREQQNRLQSRLCALPEELVLRIMFHMRLAELYLTRQVSHLFFRLCRTMRFRELNFSKETDSRTNYDNRYHYLGHDNRYFIQFHPDYNIDYRIEYNYARRIHPPLLSSPLELWQNRFAKWCNCSEKVAFTLRRQALCQPCSQRIPDEHELAEQIALHTKDVWCSACEEKHATMWFSYKQLLEQSEGSKRCILWEGCVRLCSHLSFRWNDVNDWKSRKRSVRDGVSFLECHQCLVGVSDAQNPAVRAFAEETEMGSGRKKKRYKIEMSWRLPVSVIESCSSRQRTYDNMLCPHVTWTEILRHVVPGQVPGSLECSICGFQYSWTRAKSGEQTYIQGWRMLWRSRRIPEDIYCSDLQHASKSLSLDLGSYQTHKDFSKHVLWCNTKGCYNAQGDFRNILRDYQPYKRFVYRPQWPEYVWSFIPFGFGNPG